MIARRLFFCCLLSTALAGCAGDSSLGRTIVDSGITPTSDVRSANTSRRSDYIPVGVTPALPVPDLTPAERQNIEKELLEARARVKTLASAPIDKPLPRN